MFGLSSIIVVILFMSPLLCHTCTTTMSSPNDFVAKHSIRLNVESPNMFVHRNPICFLSNSSFHRRHSRSLGIPRTKIKFSSEHFHRDVHNDSFIPVKSTAAAEEEALTAKFLKLRSLGIDYGLSRTGIAVTTGGYRPRPLAILSGYTRAIKSRVDSKDKDLTRDDHGGKDDNANIVIQYNNTRLCQAIITYATAEQVTNLVLGLPLHKNGSISEQSTLTHQFGMELLEYVRRECGTTMNVTLWDERYTSKEAASRIVNEAMARNRRVNALDLEGCLDDEAACIILEHYYQVLGKDAEVLELDEAIDEECRKVYVLKMEQKEKERLGAIEARERMCNARKEMIERARVLNEDDGGGLDGGKKKKKRKKKKTLLHFNTYIGWN
eukprot:CCRYP_016133-RB/>CCRYP_016133-RB protein AED:0.03 eAED:0.03 QI:112/1/1/1/0/0/2/1451/381